MKRAFFAVILAAAAVVTGCDRLRATDDSGAPPASTLTPVPNTPTPPKPEPVRPEPRAAANQVPVVAPPPAPAIVTGEGMPLSFAPLAKRADPSVATVKSRMERRGRRGRTEQVEGLGTAFVYDPDGFLLTNNHVVEGAVAVSTLFADGRQLPATIVGRDKHTDLAVLKVDAKGLPPLQLGDSDATDVGDWVVAIGNPFGLSHTVSAGILSAKGRTNEDVKGLDPSGYFNFLQTDASINPGNSGGPLLNLRGEVVGINSAVRANANGIGFAIPINMVKQLLPMLLKDGKISRSQIGLLVASLNSVEADRLHRPDVRGAWVQGVVPGGPAQRAGVAQDDVVVGFDGAPVRDPNQLRWLASIAGVHHVATLKIARAERVFDLKVTLAELPDDQNDRAQDDDP